MTDTPERIFRWVPPNSGGHIEYSDLPIRSPFAREYISADLVHADAELAKQHHAEAFGAGVDSAAPPVKALVFVENRNDYWSAGYGYQVAYTHKDLWRVRLHGKVVCKEVKGRAKAIAWANNHHVTNILAALEG